MQPNSYDLTLKGEFLKNGVETKDTYFLNPNEFILGSTNEYVSIPPHLTGRVEGKSSLGRLGLLVHLTAGFIDSGFFGNITLELKNLGNYPIELHKDARIGQICFYKLENTPQRLYGDYGNHYQDQVGVTESRIELINGYYKVDGR